MTQTIDSPLRASILLRAHHDPRFEWGTAAAKSPADREELDALEDAGAIECRGGMARTTELGDAWVRAILATPIPRRAFIGADGREV